MNPRDITDVEVLQGLVVELLNLVEELKQDSLSNKEELSKALDEINRLKGEKGKPRFVNRKKSKRLKPQPKESKEEPDTEANDSEAADLSVPLEVDHVERLDTPPEDLPPDAIFKGYRSIYQRDLVILPHHTEYQIGRWYSPSEGRVYEAALPPSAHGRIGSSLKSFIQMLHHGGDMTHRKISDLLNHLGIRMSSGSISEILTRSDWIEQEYEALLRTSLTESPYVQMDSTASRQQGKGMHTQVLCGEFFSLFSTQEGKSRLDVYAALQGQSRQEVRLAYTPLSIEQMKTAKVSNKHMAYFASVFTLGQTFSFQELTTHFDSAAVFAKTNQKRRSAIGGALAAGYYHQQEELPKVRCLMSDDAKEYQTVATQAHLHCWIHAIRPYRKLIPTQDYLRSIHTDFMDRLWMFYQQLKAYQKLPPDQRVKVKERLSQTFDEVFSPNTDYHKLNEQIRLTQQKRAYLLACLQFPFVPLHNNAAERGARRIVLKRKISLHTWSRRGTRIRDAFMSLHQTARKLRISFFDYLKERNEGKYQQPTMAQLVRQRYQLATATTF